MYTAIPPQPTNAQAWIAAAAAVQDAGGEAYNVVIDIANPLVVTGPDEDILTTVDHFLREHHANTLAGVANTIFPQSLLDRHGAEGLYRAYNELVLPRMKQMTHDLARAPSSFSSISARLLRLIFKSARVVGDHPRTAA